MVRTLESAKFWEPFTLYSTWLETPVGVVYPEYKPEGGIDELLPNDGTAITNHLLNVCDANHVDNAPGSPDWMHSFVWRDGARVMTDIWSTRLDSDQYPQTTIRVFRGLDEVDPVAEGLGHVGAETMLVMGLEEQYRRRVQGMGGSLTRFLVRDREHMPEYPKGYIAYSRLRRQ